MLIYVESHEFGSSGDYSVVIKGSNNKPVTLLINEQKGVTERNDRIEWLQKQIFKAVKGQRFGQKHEAVTDANDIKISCASRVAAPIKSMCSVREMCIINFMPYHFKQLMHFRNRSDV